MVLLHWRVNVSGRRRFRVSSDRARQRSPEDHDVYMLTD